MNRRQFNALAAGAGLSAAGSGLVSCVPRPAGRRGLVATPAAREAYLKRLLAEICTGPLPMHDPPVFKRAISVIQRELGLSCPGAFLDEFSFTAWRLSGAASFKAGDQALETYPAHGSSATPPEGVRGILQKTDDPKAPYAILSPAGDTLGLVTLGAFSRAIPRPAYVDGRIVPTRPIFNIGQADTVRLAEAARKRVPIQASSAAEFVPGQLSWNAVGSLAGNSRDEILFLAHADTVYATPGANDNMASVICMIMLAHQFSGQKQRHTLTFVATSGEEYGKLGAIHYAERRKSEGTFDHIKYCVNFDSLTWGINLHVTSKDERLKGIIGSIHDLPEIKGEPKFIDGLTYGDNQPFAEAGIPSVGLNSRGYDEVLEVYHRPEDTPETVHADCVENSFLVFSEFVRRLKDAAI